MKFIFRIVRFRKLLGLRRRTPANQWSLHNDELRQALHAQLATGQAARYGRRLMYHYLKRQRIVSVRDRMYTILHEIDPVGIIERPFGLQRTPRGLYQVLGVNFVWSVDGHHKLSDYGIEIYAGIDSYSRYG